MCYNCLKRFPITLKERNDRVCRIGIREKYSEDSKATNVVSMSLLAHTNFPWRRRNFEGRATLGHYYMRKVCGNGTILRAGAGATNTPWIVNGPSKCQQYCITFTFLNYNNTMSKYVRYVRYWTDHKA